jgi:murein DD-endopeptidase MepM/ murein hydrolase activator NlpD
LVKSVTSAILLAIFAIAFAVPGQAGAAQTAGGGLLVPGVPKIKDIVCVSGCTEIRASSAGGTVQVSGTGMTRVNVVRFPARKGNLRSVPVERSSTSLVVKVPKGAITGRIRVVSSTGSLSAPAPRTLKIGPPPPAQNSPLRISDARTRPAVAFQYGARRPRLEFVLSGGRASNDIRIDVVNAKGSVISSRSRLDVPRGSSQRFTWSGKSGRRPAPNGRYRFVVRSLDGTKAIVSSQLRRERSARGRGPFSFSIYGYVFPVRARHSYGDGIGAGRGHQGIDVMARCGAPLIAARGGIVHYNSYQASGAGNYLVINTAGTGGQSHVYMHLAARSPLKVGSRVKTGQRIGVVGTTGRSTACHLHFEKWSAPGWYQGGTFLDPTRSIKNWDRYS